MSRSPPASQDALALKLLRVILQSLEAFGLSESQKSSRSRGPLTPEHSETTRGVSFAMGPHTPCARFAPFPRKESRKVLIQSLFDRPLRFELG
jgi:hypothetical protein